MFDILLKGFLIGILTSIPVGPIAMLCIQKTLNKGRMHGFFSGLGAATSDTTYAMIALFGLSFVMQFIEQNQLLIQIIGSVVILLFGVYIFSKNPVAVLSKNVSTKESYLQDYLASVLLTLSNPLIVFLFLGLFARFSFLSGTESVFYSLSGILAVFAGASTWWFVLTLVASAFRKKLNLRGLWVINKLTGSIIIILSMGGLILSIMGKSVNL
jgi:threonine/homoserine/homoserine lactone efflux protein